MNLFPPKGESLALLRKTFGEKVVEFYNPITGLNIGDFDKWLGKQDSEYDNVKCKYQGETVSCCGYILKKYGIDVEIAIKALF